MVQAVGALAVEATLALDLDEPPAGEAEFGQAQPLLVWPTACL